MFVEYVLQESARARHLRITIHPDGRVVATKPSCVGVKKVEEFVASRIAWIEKSRVAFLKKSGGLAPILLPKPRKGSKAYRDAIIVARTLVNERLEYFGALYTFNYGSVSIRNQKTRWGSCSSRNNLSFNYRIQYLPPELIDYIIVHELCHTIEHNHSPKFWALVSRTLPKHREMRRMIHTRYLL